MVGYGRFTCPSRLVPPHTHYGSRIPPCHVALPHTYTVFTARTRCHSHGICTWFTCTLRFMDACHLPRFHVPHYVRAVTLYTYLYWFTTVPVAAFSSSHGWVLFAYIHTYGCCAFPSALPFAHHGLDHWVTFRLFTHGSHAFVRFRLLHHHNRSRLVTDSRFTFITPLPFVIRFYRHTGSTTVTHHTTSLLRTHAVLHTFYTTTPGLVPGLRTTTVRFTFSTLARSLVLVSFYAFAAHWTVSLYILRSAGSAVCGLRSRLAHGAVASRYTAHAFSCRLLPLWIASFFHLSRAHGWFTYGSCSSRGFRFRLRLRYLGLLSPNILSTQVTRCATAFCRYMRFVFTCTAHVWFCYLVTLDLPLRLRCLWFSAHFHYTLSLHAFSRLPLTRFIPGFASTVFSMVYLVYTWLSSHHCIFFSGCVLNSRTSFQFVHFMVHGLLFAFTKLRAHGFAHGLHLTALTRFGYSHISIPIPLLLHSFCPFIHSPPIPSLRTHHSPPFSFPFRFHTGLRLSRSPFTTPTLFACYLRSTRSRSFLLRLRCYV